MSPRHVESEKQQKDAAGDPEGRQGDAEEPQQRQPGHIEKGEEGEGEEGDVEGGQSSAGRRRADGRGREEGHVAHWIDEGEQGDEEIDRELDLGGVSQKSTARPLRSQSPYRVGSGPLGPPVSTGTVMGSATRRAAASARARVA